MVTSTLLTLLVIPVIYTLFSELEVRLGMEPSGKEKPAAVATGD